MERESVSKIEHSQKIRYEAAFADPRMFLPLAACLVLFVSARLFHLTEYGLWLDEVFSLRIARLDWATLFQQVINDAVHPPLFYALLKVWVMIGGESLVWLKSFPVLLSSFSLASLYLLCRSLGLRPVVFCLTVAIVSLNSYLIYYAQELRMYSLLSFLGLLSMWLFVTFLNNGSGSSRRTLALFAANLLLIYTHYFGWMVVIAELGTVIIYARPRLRSFFLQTLALGACFLPWAVIVVTAVSARGGLGQNLGWIVKPSLVDMVRFLGELHGSLPIRYAVLVSLLIFLPPALIGFVRVFRNRQQAESLVFVFLAFVSGIPLAAAFTASQFLASSVWGDRYLIAAAIPYILLTAVGAASIRRPSVRTAVVILMTTWSLAAGTWNLLATRSRVNWLDFSHRISQKESGGGVSKFIYTFEDWAAWPLQEALGPGSLSVVQRIDGIERVGGGEYWLLYRSSTWKGPESVREKIERSNCTIEQEVVDRPHLQDVVLLDVDCNAQRNDH